MLISFIHRVFLKSVTIWSTGLPYSRYLKSFTENSSTTPLRRKNTAYFRQWLGIRYERKIKCSCSLCVLWHNFITMDKLCSSLLQTLALKSSCWGHHAKCTWFTAMLIRICNKNSIQEKIYEVIVKGIFVTLVTNKICITIVYFIFIEELNPFQLLCGMGK